MKNRPNSNTIYKLFSVVLPVCLLFSSLSITDVSAARDQNAGTTTFNPGVKQAKTADKANLLQFTSSGTVLGFSSTGVYATNGRHSLHVSFIGSENVQPISDNTVLVKGKAAPLSKVSYKDLWPGVTLAYTSASGSIYTTSYSISPGANPEAIQLQYNTDWSLNADGTLSISFNNGTLTESAPIAWQEIHGRRVPVDVSFKVNEKKVGFALGAYDQNFYLTIDPSLTWNTFLGGSGDDNSPSITLDGNGNVFVTGSSNAAWSCSPVPCTIHAYTGNTDVFIAKLDSTGSLMWNTFLGGSIDDYVMGIALDGSGNIYVSGFSYSAWSCMPVTCTTRAYTGNTDIFIAKLDLTGALLWNSFLGGSGGDNGVGIAVDGSGNTYVTGHSTSSWGCSPTPCTVRPDRSGDTFVAELDASGNLIWNTFLGSQSYDHSISLDSIGNIYIVGTSSIAWGCSPTPCTVREFTDSSGDAYVAKLNTSGDLLWNTFLGGDGYEYGLALDLDADGNIYAAGSSDATGTSGAIWGCSPVPCTKRAYTSKNDGFVAKLDPSGNLTWNTFLGGSGDDYVNSISVDSNGNIIAGGGSETTWGSPLRPYSSGWDASLAEIDPSGNLLWNTFLGGSGDDPGGIIALDETDGNIYIAGFSNVPWGCSPAPCTVRSYTNGQDVFIAKVANYFTISGNAGVAGATLAYTDGTDKMVTSIGDGSYSFTVSYNWSGTVTPSKDGYTFSPTYKTYSNVQSDQPGQNYTAIPLTYTISGNAGVAGVTLAYSDVSDKTVTSADDGSYSFTVPDHWSGTVTPSLACYTFNPPALTYGDVTGDQIGQGYTATLTTGCDVGSGTYDDTDVHWVFSNGWLTRALPGPYNNTDHYTRTVGASASFTFNGNAFAFTYVTASNRGRIRVYVDGKLVTTLNAHNSKTTWGKTYKSPIFALGIHTVTFTNAGPPNTYIDIDAFTVTVPDVTAPGAINDLTANPGLITGLMDLLWTAPSNNEGDVNSGPVTSYLVRYSTSPIVDDVTWDTATPVTTNLPTPLSPGNTQFMPIYGLTTGIQYYFSVRAQDITQNLAELSNSPFATNSVPPIGAGIYDDTDLGWIYSDGWDTYTGIGPYNDTVHYTSTAGASASVIFTGTGFKLSYTTARTRGTFVIKVDGNVIATINASSSILIWQKAYTSPILAPGDHTVTITNLGRRRTNIDVDAIQVMP